MSIIQIHHDDELWLFNSYCGDSYTLEDNPKKIFPGKFVVKKRSILFEDMKRVGLVVASSQESIDDVHQCRWLVLWSS